MTSDSFDFYQNRCDEDLIDLCIQRDEQAFEELVNRYQGKIFRYFRNRGIDPHLAEDLTQGTLLTIWSYFESFNRSSMREFWSWLYRVASQQIPHHFRKKSNRELPTSLSTNSSSDDGQQNAGIKALNDNAIAQYLEEEKASESWERLVEGFSSDDQHLLILKFVENASLKEIASDFGVSVSTVSSRLSRICERLRGQLVK